MKCWKVCFIVSVLLPFATIGASKSRDNDGVDGVAHLRWSAHTPVLRRNDSILHVCTHTHTHTLQLCWCVLHVSFIAITGVSIKHKCIFFHDIPQINSFPSNFIQVFLYNLMLLRFFFYILDICLILFHRVSLDHLTLMIFWSTLQSNLIQVDSNVIFQLFFFCVMLELFPWWTL